MDPSYPILEYDPTPEALIEPSRIIRPLDIAEHCVLCFFQDVIGQVCGDGKTNPAAHLGSEALSEPAHEPRAAKVVNSLVSEMGNNPVYEIEVGGRRLTVTHPGVGAPLSAGFLEELIALGCRKFIACGGAGVLNKEIAVGHVVVPSSAVRDEGTSYHYLPPGREVCASPDGVAAIVATMEAHHIPYVVGKTWTTDAIYRETPARIARRKAEGCITVEMEAAAFFAVAQFRGVTFAQILYGGDDVSGDVWDNRDWVARKSVRESLFWLAAEACLKL